ncbi:MAG: cytochrome P450, partial [Burkholderiales bacterium]
YGPFKRNGRHTALSNEAFDASLRENDPEWGVRDLEAVAALAAAAGFGLEEVVEMPANNLSIILRMTTSGRHAPDWDPRSEEVLRDQVAAYDGMRERCPVAYSELMQWSVFRHEDVVRVLHDPETFSSAVSRHVAIPAGMDPPEHTEFRRLIDPYFAPARMDALAPACRAIALELVRRGDTELMAEVALPFSVRAQCAFLGWPAEMEQPLGAWTRRNYEATLAQDRAAMADIAREFEGFVGSMLEARRRSGARPQDDATASLMHETVHGRPVRDKEIVNILRTWTVGEIGSIASAAGILAYFLAAHPELQARLRAEPSRLGPAIDEILRIHGPLVASRRVATRPVEIAGRRIGAGEGLSLNWVAANRDARAFEAPDTFRPDRDPERNLLYGAGIHACPGAPLARMQLRAFVDALFERSSLIALLPDRPPARARYPASGFATLPLRIS